jgi:hypothetical protein
MRPPQNRRKPEYRLAFRLHFGQQRTNLSQIIDAVQFIPSRDPFDQIEIALLQGRGHPLDFIPHFLRLARERKQVRFGGFGKGLPHRATETGIEHKSVADTVEQI